MALRRIFLFTDCVDVAANELRISLVNALGDTSEAIVEPFVPISPAFSVINTNFVVRLIADSCPDGSVLMTTINAEKERPRNVIGRTQKKGLVFIGRDMGSFDWLTRDLGCAELYDLGRHNEGGFISFAGKYTTAPLAAKAALGTPLSTLGQAIPSDSVHRLELPDGVIVHVDNFGMMKFTGTLEDQTDGARYLVSINGHEIDAVFGRRLMSYETGQWVLFPGSSFNLFELGKVREIGAPTLGARVGTLLSLRCK